MLVYLIDAFNVIYKVPELKHSSSPRGDFVRYIRKNNLTGSSNNKVTIVFDGFAPISDTPSGQYDIVFSGGLSADDIIKKRAVDSKSKKQLIVVTDDHGIRDSVKGLNVKLLNVNDFLNKAQKSLSASGREEISESLQREITDAMRQIWDKEEK